MSDPHASFQNMPKVMRPQDRIAKCQIMGTFMRGILKGAEGAGKRRMGGVLYQWRIPECPFCGKDHVHGAGSFEDYADGTRDPVDISRTFLGWRVPHCETNPPPDNGQYFLSDQSGVLPLTEDQSRKMFGQARPKGVQPMTGYVRFYRDGDHLAVQTNCTEEDEFMRHFAQAIASSVSEHRLSDDETRAFLKHGFEIACKLRGYKAQVEEQRVLTAGPSNWSHASPIFSSEPREEATESVAVS